MDKFSMDNKNSEEKESRRRMAAEARKANKPLMEKRRRERINTCLDQLKDILMDATKKESSYYSKLEKADILEMTVKYLKNLKRQQMSPTGSSSSSAVSDSSTRNKYIAGFNECTQEVSRYLNSIHGLNDDVRGNMLGHLADCLHKDSNVNTTTPKIAPATSLVSISTHQTPAIYQKTSTAQPLQIQTQSMMANPQGNLCVISPAGSQQQQQTTIQQIQPPAMQLVPAKLPSGETVFVLASAGNVIASNLNIAPVVSAQPAPNLISFVDSSIDTINGNQDSRKWSTPQPTAAMVSPLMPRCSTTKPSTISKSPSSDEEENVFDIRSGGSRGHIKTSSPVLSDHNANISHQQSSFTMPSYTPIHSSATSTNSFSSMLSQTPTRFSFTGNQMRTPKSPLDDSRNESVSSTSDASLSSPLERGNERLLRPSASAPSAQPSPQLFDNSASLLDPMWRPW